MIDRKQAVERIAGETFDVCVIGGGATGAGCGLDAQLRGLKTVIVEAGDFVSGSSTASTKLVHGGVRYLQEAVVDRDAEKYRLVKLALRERALMLNNAPHLTRAIENLVPCYSYFEKLYYGLGLKLYDWIAGKSSLFASRILTRDEAIARMPRLQSKRLTGAVAYADGQFDDARYGIALVSTFTASGGQALSYARVTAIEKNNAGKLESATIADCAAGGTFRIRARAFVNATGPASDIVRRLAADSAAPRMRPSKGVHIVFALDGFSETCALLVPSTEDGRVVFAIPWNGRLLVGTTDTGYSPGDEMVVTRAEIDYLLRQLNPYLRTPFTAGDVVSAFAGIRPLVAAQGVTQTRKLIRDDEVEFDPATGLVSILGGKWTTYRLMAEKTIDCVQRYLGGAVTPTLTRHYPLAGSLGFRPDYWRELVSRFHVPVPVAQHLARQYGTLAPEVWKLAVAQPSLAQPIVEGHPSIRAQVIYSVREEMAWTIEDVLARRIGLQWFGWRLAIQAAPIVAALLRHELSWTPEQEAAAVQQYTGKLSHLLVTAAQGGAA